MRAIIACPGLAYGIGKKIVLAPFVSPMLENKPVNFFYFFVNTRIYVTLSETGLILGGTTLGRILQAKLLQ